MRVTVFSMLICFGLNLFAADDLALWDPKEYDENSEPQFGDVVGYLDDEKYVIAKCEVIVDLGCLVGKTTNYLAELCPGATVVGVDPEEKAINYAREHYATKKNTLFICKRGQDYKLSDHNLYPADFVACYHVLHWIGREELPKLFENVNQNMKRGAILDLVTSAQQETTNLFRAAKETFTTWKWGWTALKSLPKLLKDQDDVYTLLTKEELEKLAVNSGMHVDSCQEIDTTARFSSKDVFAK